MAFDSLISLYHSLSFSVILSHTLLTYVVLKNGRINWMISYQQNYRGNKITPISVRRLNNDRIPLELARLPKKFNESQLNISSSKRTLEVKFLKIFCHRSWAFASSLRWLERKSNFWMNLDAFEAVQILDENQLSLEIWEPPDTATSEVRWYRISRATSSEHVNNRERGRSTVIFRQRCRQGAEQPRRARCFHEILRHHSERLSTCVCFASHGRRHQHNPKWGRGRSWNDNWVEMDRSGFWRDKIHHKSSSSIFSSKLHKRELSRRRIVFWSVPRASRWADFIDNRASFVEFIRPHVHLKLWVIDNDSMPSQSVK